MMTETEHQPMWHYEDDGAARGPTDERRVRELIRSGTVRRTTLVWRKGYPGWVEAGRSDLSDLFDEIPPPLPRRRPLYTEESKDAAPPSPGKRPVPWPEPAAAPRPEPDAPAPDHRPVQRWANNARVLVPLFALMSAVALVHHVTVIAFASRSGAGAFASAAAAAAAAEAVAGRGDAVGIMLLLLGVLAFAAFLCWQHAASRFLHRTRSVDMRHSAWMPIASLLLPVVNLVLPYLAVQEIWRKSSNPFASREPSPTVVRWWWLFLLAGTALAVGSASATTVGASADVMLYAGAAAVVAHLFLIAASVLMFVIVGRATERQRMFLTDGA